MARSIRVPLHVIKSKISPSAKLLWIELALSSSPKRPQVAIDRKILAEKTGHSKATVGRLIRELEKAELLVYTGVVNRYDKTYNLVWAAKKLIEEKIEKPVRKPVSALDLIPSGFIPEAERIFKECTGRMDFDFKMSEFLRERGVACQP
ncbi:MAG: helix-turn-helix domain-containing protein [Myxococcaceae bacterium]